MISKKVAMKAAEKSRFGKLVAYLLDPQGKKTRVGEVSITNCVSSDTTWAVREITATQRLNARAISDRTYHLLVSLRGNKVLRFEPAAASGSCCFNPMAELRLGTEHEVGDVQNLALLITDPHGRGMDRGDHWQKTAYSLLVGCILHLCYKAKVEGTPATFGALDKMLADSNRPIKDLWDEMLTYAHVNGENHPVVSATARDMLDRPANEAGSGLSTAKTFLCLFR